MVLPVGVVAVMISMIKCDCVEGKLGNPLFWTPGIADGQNNVLFQRVLVWLAVACAVSSTVCSVQ